MQILQESTMVYGMVPKTIVNGSTNGFTTFGGTTLYGVWILNLGWTAIHHSSSFVPSQTMAQDQRTGLWSDPILDMIHPLNMVCIVLLNAPTKNIYLPCKGIEIEQYAGNTIG